MAPGSAEAITPPEGWRVQSPFGVLKTNTGVRLARLEDVHAWLMQRDGMSSASAVARVFGAFAADANSATGMEHGAEKVRESLHILDLSHDAEPVRGWAGRHFLREVAELIPYVPHHRFDRGAAGALMYALGLMAGEVWAPHDVEIDLNDRLEGYCAEGYFPTVAKAREILGRFAVPFAAAHALWGWGTVNAGAVDKAAAPAGQLDRGDVKDFGTLCRYLGPYKGKDGSEWPSWEAEWVGYVRAAVKAHDAANGRGGKAAVGRALGMKSEGEGVAQLFKRYPEPKASLFPTARDKAA